MDGIWRRFDSEVTSWCSRRDVLDLRAAFAHTGVVRYSAWGLSDVGRKRDHNEDSLLINHALGLYAVADGMGGHQGGGQASRIAVETLEREVASARQNGLLGPTSSGSGSVTKLLERAAHRAGERIWHAAQGDPDLEGMGTTLTALLVHQGRAHLAHVGDSRCYLYRDGRCTQLTEDHSWVNEQVRAGLLTLEQARASRLRHIITRSVGYERSVTVDGLALAIEPGDCFLLCSDGLSNLVELEELARVLVERFYKHVPPTLVELANERGGDDNITVLLVHAANDADHAPS